MEDRPCLQFFLAPQHTFQRQYEALRAIVVGGEPLRLVAERFGYKVPALKSMATGAILAVAVAMLTLVDRLTIDEVRPTRRMSRIGVQTSFGGSSAGFSTPRPDQMYQAKMTAPTT